MESNDNLEVIPPPSLNPLEIMPAKLWDKVLEFLGSDLDQLREVSKTCLLFEALLADKLNNGCRLERVLPLVLQWLPPMAIRPSKEILNCRLVSKRFQECVDGVLGSMELIGDLRHLNLYKPGILLTSPVPVAVKFGRLQVQNILMNIFTSADSARVISYLNMTEDLCLFGTGKTIFRGRSLQIRHNQREENYDPTVDQYQVLLHRSLCFLRQPVFTNWIGFLKLSGTYKTNDAVKMYQTVAELISSLSNLEAFSLDICLETMDERNLFFAPCDGWTSDASSELSTYMSGHPLPEMPTLKHISLQGHCPLDLFVDLCRRYGRQLKSFEMDITEPLNVFVGPYLGFQPCSFPVLSSLRIAKSHLHEAPLPIPQVKHLELNVNFVSEMQCQDQVSLAKFPNLETLVFWKKVTVAGVLGRLTTICERLQFGRFPNIKHLQLRGILELNCSMELIAKIFPGLESIEIQFHLSDSYDGPRVDAKSQKDWKLLEKGRGYELKIWKLKTFKLFRVTCNGSRTSPPERLCGEYTRDGFQRFCDGKRTWLSAKKDQILGIFGL